MLAWIDSECGVQVKRERNKNDGIDSDTATMVWRVNQKITGNGDHELILVRLAWWNGGRWATEDINDRIG